MKKVLFFDDEPFIIGYLIKSLREIYGWSGDKEIVFVSTVGELLDKLNSDETYSLFVLDIMVPMPSGELIKLFTQQELDEMNYGMNTGLVMAKRIRKMEKYKIAPILYLSAKTSPYISNIEKKYTKHIRKPVHPNEVSKKMNELLKIE